MPDECEGIEQCCDNNPFNYEGRLTFSSTEEFTATCPEGFVGEPVTESATATSMISQADADAQALAAATELAEAQLECIAIDVSWTSEIQRSTSSGSTTIPGSGTSAAASLSDSISQATTNAAGMVAPTPSYPLGPTPAGQEILTFIITINTLAVASVNIAVSFAAFSRAMWNRNCVGGGRVTQYHAYQINAQPGQLPYFFDQFSSAVTQFERTQDLVATYNVPIIAGVGLLAIQTKSYAQTPGYILCPDYGQAIATSSLTWEILPS